MLKIMDFGGAIAMRDKSNPFLLETSPIKGWRRDLYEQCSGLKILVRCAEKNSLLVPVVFELCLHLDAARHSSCPSDVM